MSFKKAFVKNLFILGGFTYLTQIIGFLSSLVTARLLTPESFGLVGLITVFSGFISIFSDGGISIAIIRFDYGEAYYRSLHTLAMYVGICLCFIMLALSYPISIFYNNNDLILPGIAIGLLFVIRSQNIVPSSILKKQLAFSDLGAIALYSSIGGIVTTIIMAYYGFDYWSLIGSQYVTAIMTTVLTHRRLPFPNSFASFVAVKDAFLTAKSLIGNLLSFGILSYWCRNLDNMLVGKFYGVSELGIYNRAYSLLTIPLGLITGLFSSVLYPSLVDVKKKGGNVLDEYYFILKVISIINIPIGMILILFPIPFVEILWGNRWGQVAELLPYFGILVLTQTALSTVGSFLILEGKERVLMQSGWVGVFTLMVGIVYGALISIKAVAAFYALSHILLNLTFNMIYVYYKTLNHSLRIVLTFWLPKIILSLLIWVAVYWNIKLMIYTGVVLWLLMIILDCHKEVRRIYQYASNFLR